MAVGHVSPISDTLSSAGFLQQLDHPDEHASQNGA
jgi:hypothetical protein